MITFSHQTFNSILNNSIIFNETLSILYSSAINEIDYSQLCCPHCHCTSLTRHAYYHRFIKCGFNKIQLSILRVHCSNCNHTHAILPDWITPYSQFLTQDLHSIIISITHEDISSILDSFIDIQLSHIRYIKTQYNKYWKSRLSLFDASGCLIPLTHLISFSFENYGLQFMQIRQIINQLYIPT